MKNKLILPFTQMYDRRDRIANDDGSITYYLGRKLVYRFNHIRKLHDGTPITEARFELAGGDDYYHRTDGKPAYDMESTRMTWDIGGLVFCNIIPKAGHTSYILTKAHGLVSTQTLDVTDYHKAAELWKQHFGDDWTWMEKVADNKRWPHIWRAIVTKANLRFEEG